MPCRTSECSIIRHAAFFNTVTLTTKEKSFACIAKKEEISNPKHPWSA